MARQGAIGVEDFIVNKVATLRRWKKTKLFKIKSNWNFTFKIMTYNILSQSALDFHMYLYFKCNPAFLQEEYRISKILPEILKSRSDIICLQEVEKVVYDFSIKGYFHSNGFESIFKKRTGNKSDGCAILWRRSKFSLTDQCDIEFRTKNSKLLNRDNVGLIAVLQPNHPKFNQTLLYIATTHLLFNPRRGDVKFCQLRWLLAELERMSVKEVINNKRYHHPVVLCGDFNFEPNSSLYRFVETGCIDIVPNTKTGDLSGQTQGKGKGDIVTEACLDMHELGINNASRFESTAAESEVPNNLSGCSSFHTVAPDRSEDAGLSAAGRRYQTLLALSNKKLTPEEKNFDETTSCSSGAAASATAEMLPVESSDSSEDEQQTLSYYHDLKFVPVYKYRGEDNKSHPITSMPGGDATTVDHIFYSVRKKRDIRSYDEGCLKLLSFYSLMQKDDIKELGGLPNAGMGSDHLPLMATFALHLRR